MSDVPSLSCCPGFKLPTKINCRYILPGQCPTVAFPLTWNGSGYGGGKGFASNVRVGCKSNATGDLTIDWDGICGDHMGSLGGPSCSPLTINGQGGIPASCCIPGGTGTVNTTCEAGEGVSQAEGTPPPVCVPCPDDPSKCCDFVIGMATQPVMSTKPIRYATGEVALKSADIASGGFGVPWGHTRSFASMQSVNETLGQGFCWKIQEWSYLIIQSDGSVVIQGAANTSWWFTLLNGAYVPSFNSKRSLAHDAANNVYRFYDLNGTVTVFDDFSGAFLSQTDAAGNSVQVTALSGNGFNPAKVQRTYTDPSGNTTIEQYSYTYDSSTGDYLLTNILLQRQVNAGAWQNVSQASYTYYPDGVTNGAYEDLQSVTTQLYSNGAWANTGTTYYRYWKQLPSSSSSSSSGSSIAAGQLSVHLVKYVLLPAMYDQMVAAGFDPTTASDAQLSLFADFYYEYDQSRRCTKEIVSAGSQTFSFAYSQSGNPQGYNSWATKTVETLPDGNQKIIYSNYAGQTMLSVFQQTGTSNQWCTYYQFDSSANLILQANPSAVNGFSDAFADLVNWQNGTAQYLNKTSGLINTYTIHAPTGWNTGELVQQGQWGLPIIVRQYEYIACCVPGSSSSSSSSSTSSGSSSSSSGVSFTAPCRYLKSKLIEYPDDGSSSSSSSSSSSASGPATGTANGNTRQIITSYTYTFWPGTCAVQQKTTTWPVIPTSQNGSGVAAQMLEYFDVYGNLIWKMDERGFITGMTYDIPTGALSQRIDDVDTTQVSAPSGWVTPSGGGLHLITNFQFDSQGRQTQSLGPIHTIDLNGVATSIRRASYTVYQDGLFQTWIGQGYQKTSDSSYWLMNPVAITITRKDGKITDQIQAVRFTGAAGSSSSSSSGSASGCPPTATAPVTTMGALSAFDSFPQCSYVRWTTTEYSDCCFVASQRVYKLIPAAGIGVSGTNYDETDFGYDVMKRQNRVVTPGGTITRTVFDAPGRAIGTWVGTNDAGATASNPAGSGPPNNMVQVTGTVYDNGNAAGDSNPTQSKKFVDATGANDRVTTFLFDFRNRHTDTDGEINFYAKQYFDNLDRIFKNERYDTTPAGNLIMRDTASFDDHGVVFQTATYAVDPSTGVVGNALTDNTWRDASQHIVKSLPAGSQLFKKTTFDSLGRQTVQYTGYGTDANYTAIFSVASNTILEQTESTYDAASNAIETVLRKRYDNAPASQLGSLGDPSTTPNARVAYAAAYPDALGRTQATADYGTNGGTGLSRPSTIPARSDSCLVTSIQFDAAANSISTTDPAGAVTCHTFDAVPREISRVMNCTTQSSSSSSSNSTGGCVPSADMNVTILTAYTADGLVDSITAVNPLTNNQKTQYVYGTTLSTSAVANALLKVAEILPDSVDGSDQITWTYNRQGETTTMTDQNGTIHAYVRDKLARETDDCVTTIGTGIDDAVLRVSSTFEVRGMLENVTSYDNATVGSGRVVNDVLFTYNSFAQLAADYQSHSGGVDVSTTPGVQYAYADGSANTVRPTSMTFPDGRVLHYDFGAPGGVADSASRVASLIDDDGLTHLADYSYLGGSLSPFSPGGRGTGGEGASLPTLASPFSADTIVQVSSPEPGVQYTLIGVQPGNDPLTGDIYRGLDLFSRVKDLIWAPCTASSSSSSSSSKPGPGTNLVRIQHTYDRMSNRLSRRDLVAESYGVGLDEFYQYDMINRLNELNRGTLNSTSTGINPGSGTFNQCWTLDTTGNWSGFREDDTGDGIWDLVQSRTANPVNETIAITNAVGSVWAQPKYDAAGNMTTVPQPADPTTAFTATYDAWNRLVKVVDKPSGNTVAQYAYDGARRRTIKETYAAGVLSETRHFFYTGPERSQIVEERVGTSTTAERQFIWGLRYIDDLIVRDRETTGGGTLTERLYALQDPNWNMLAVVTSAGALQERYCYDAYGTATFLTPAFASRTSSIVQWQILYASYVYDTNTGHYSVRNRVFDPFLGWLQRDSLGATAGINLYRYVENNPVRHCDPSGLLPPISLSCAILIGAILFGAFIGGAIQTYCAFDCATTLKIWPLPNTPVPKGYIDPWRPGGGLFRDLLFNCMATCTKDTCGKPVILAILIIDALVIFSGLVACFAGPL